jgi:hypothetical protein
MYSNRVQAVLSLNPKKFEQLIVVTESIFFVMLVIVDSEVQSPLAKVDNEIKISTIVIDVTEQKIVRPKKVNKSRIPAKRSVIL